SVYAPTASSSISSRLVRAPLADHVVSAVVHAAAERVLEPVVRIQGAEGEAAEATRGPADRGTGARVAGDGTDDRTGGGAEETTEQAAREGLLGSIAGDAHGELAAFGLVLSDVVRLRIVVGVDHRGPGPLADAAAREGDEDCEDGQSSHL